MENVTVLRLPWDFFAVPISSIQTIPNYNIPPAKNKATHKKVWLRDHATNKGDFDIVPRNQEENNTSEEEVESIGFLSSMYGSLLKEGEGY